MAKRKRTDDESVSLESADEELTPVEPEPEESGEPEPPPAPEPPPPESRPEESGTPPRQLSAVPLNVFLTMCGAKRDQMAGFRRFAINEKMSPRTVPEWRAAHAAFMKRPTR